ncbi:Tetratricopeptide repeat protein [Rhodovastum atsumiense]|uniref:Tetratricopeptide repeat protein n=1 Tax=Rhodovastum atsumiense TaxID=504468 RepID=A0A5M6IST9_9PROT|nr:tetratricopeptide repeat-containing glycosyltransferase family protein [Rhodovastum atsumiense]KAA5611384.1 tetratricopeptide repeat protein [Rhodovastum atsumiense]CAH2603609.1 Tetratricopeptide repeat protein [Rhodovastum atsumiense]
MRDSDRLARLRTAFAALREGRFAAAREVLAPLAETGAEDVETGLLYGLALAGTDAPEAAAARLVRIAALRPGHAHPLSDLIGLLTAQGRAEAAEPCLRAALALTPHDPRLLGIATGFLLEAGRAGEALDLLRGVPAGRLSPNLLGIALAAVGDTAAAAAQFHAATRANAQDAVAWANLGKALSSLGRVEEALAAFDTALRLRPADVQIGINRALALLRFGRFREGWEAYEWRLRLPGHATLPLAQRLEAADLQAGLAGKSVLLTHEEGFGDTLQFVRYARKLAHAGAEVSLLVPPELARLGGGIAGVTRVGSDPRALPRFDRHCPMLSLPRVFATTIETIPAEGHYITAAAPDLARWGAHLAALPGLRIGLAWAGGSRPTVPAARLIDRMRSIPPAMLAPLAGLADVSLVSLQLPATAQPDLPGLCDPMPQVRDFADTAAIIAHLDLVVSVDTAVAHLAGAMGKKVFLLDRFDPCWRWLRGREDSPWYPTLRIFRQARPQDWADVIARIATAIRGFSRQNLAETPRA